MRFHFEDKFDHIRLENDDILGFTRNKRDECAQRICDLIDSKSALSDRRASTQRCLLAVESLEKDLVEQLHNLESECAERTSLLSQISESMRCQNAHLKSEIDRLDTVKAALRDEIRDLRGFIRIHEGLSNVDGGSGATIVATNVGKARSTRK